MRELFDNVFMLEGETFGRPLQIVYLKGEEASLIVDTGCTHDPSRFIVPQMKRAGGDPRRLSWIVNTHPDLDHIGGNREMKRLAPQAVLACGDLDREACGSFDDLFRLRYDAYHRDHRIFYSGETLKVLRREGGTRQPIEVGLRGGEHLRLGPGWELEILHVPGHAKGHLAIHDLKHRALYGGDAIHGRVYLGLDGKPKLCPTYLHLDDYLSTLQLVAHLPLKAYVGAHWPVKWEGEVRGFCEESRDFVEKADALVLNALERPRTLRELCLALGPQLGDWPRETDLELVYALEGHVSRLVARGLAVSRLRRRKPRLLEFVLA